MLRWVIAIQVAIRSLAGNKLRAGLNILGIVIGIAAVTTMVSIGQSAGALVTNELAGIGSNVIVVIPQSQQRGGVRSGMVVTLTSADAMAIKTECSGVMAISPIVGTSGQVIYGGSNWSPREILGVNDEFLNVRNWDLQSGGFFTRREIDVADKVCIIGKTLVAKLFQTTNPIGAQVRIRDIPFQVIGVLEEKGANFVGEDEDDILLLPYTTVQKRMQGETFVHVHALMLSARTSEVVGTTTEEIKQLLHERHRVAPGMEPDFQVQSLTEIAGILNTITGTLTALLASIAGISLLVGGVGIMNMMLVTVTERTREIGIRRAVGAKRRDILRQFLVESIVLSAIGGTLGLVLGVSTSALTTQLINQVIPGGKWPTVVSVPAATLAIVFSVLVGVFFGFYPARKASLMHPIDALRHE
jgi:putative ABC transport system permease protein